MTRTARRIDVRHEGAEFHEKITVKAESGPVTLTWVQAREITRWTESIAQAARSRENFRRHRLIRQAEQQLAELQLNLDEGRAVRDYYLAKFYNPRIPMRCHW